MHYVKPFIFITSLLHELLPDGVDEVCIRGSEAGGAHVAGNLATMICGVGNDVEQNVIDSVGPAFSPAIHIADVVRQTGLFAFLEVNPSMRCRARPP